MYTLMQELLSDYRAVNEKPLAIHTSGTSTYVIHNARTVGTTTGYPIFRITEVTADQIYNDSGFLLEEDRVAGANGSTANVNLKTDAANTILLLTNPTISYG